MDLKRCEIRFEKLDEIDIDKIDINDFQDMVWELEEDVQSGIDFSVDPSEKKGFKKLIQKIMRLKQDNDFYDPDTESNNMFPN